jgi:hypothetical protein
LLIVEVEEVGRVVYSVRGLPSANHQSSIINHQSSIINHQSSIINHQSSIINHQSSIINHQSSIINHQSPITNHQSPITNHQSPRAKPFFPQNQRPSAVKDFWVLPWDSPLASHLLPAVWF